MSGDNGALWRVYNAETMPEPSELRWVWDQRLPRGALSFIGGTGGVGKSVIAWALAFSVATGRPFLDAETDAGPVIYADFDSEPEAQGFMMNKVRRGLRLSKRDIAGLVTYLAPGGMGQPLTQNRLESLRERIADTRPALVIIDAFTSALYTVRSNDTESVAGAMAALKMLTTGWDDEPGPCVLFLDHSPKPVQNGPSAVERGIIGSTMKLAQSRAGYLITRVPPRDVDGRDVLGLHTLKSNLGPIHEPIGVERTWEHDAVQMSVCDLPEGETAQPAIRKAMTAAREALDSTWVPRQRLVDHIVKRANAQQRTVASALSRLVAQGLIETQPDPDDTRRRLYRLAPVTPGTDA